MIASCTMILVLHFMLYDQDNDEKNNACLYAVGYQQRHPISVWEHEAIDNIQTKRCE